MAAVKTDELENVNKENSDVKSDEVIREGENQTDQSKAKKKKKKKNKAGMLFNMTFILKLTCVIECFQKIFLFVVSQNSPEDKPPTNDTAEDAKVENQAEEEGETEEKKKKKKRNRNKGGKGGKNQTDPPSIPITDLFPDGT